MCNKYLKQGQYNDTKIFYRSKVENIDISKWKKNINIL